MRKGILLIIIAMGLFNRVDSQEVIAADTLVGCDTLRVNFTLLNAGSLSDYSSIIWDFGDGNTMLNTLTPEHLYSAGTFSVSCMLNGNKIITTHDDIVVRYSPVASIAWTDSTLENGPIQYYFESSTLKEAGKSYSYAWEFPDGYTTTSETVLKEFSEMGIYTVMFIITDDLGCSDTLFKKVPVSEELLIANVFTPNGDGMNDYFEVTTSGSKIYRFTVYSRSGLTVFKSESPRIFWDGKTFDGKDVSMGVYYYLIESVDDNSTEQTGFVYVYR